MQVKTGDRISLDAPAAAEATEDLLFRDYYTQTPRVRLTVEAATEEVMLDHTDVARVVTCAIHHPSLNMRQAVLTAIWNDPDAFRDIFRFGLQAPEAYAEIRKIVAEELGKRPAAEAAAVNESGKTLLPKLPLPAHLRGRD
jgi:hypothetical protein